MKRMGGQMSNAHVDLNPDPDWRIGMAATPKSSTHLYWRRIYVVRSVLPDGKLCCEYYSPSGAFDHAQESPADDWMTA